MKEESEDNASVEGVRAVADIVVPVLNEREMLPAFLERVGALELPLRLVFVDNGSTDGTLELLSALPGVVLIPHGENLGYGRSLVDGMRAATAEKVVIIDADCEYPPEAIPGLLSALEDSPVVYASRFLSGGRPDMSRTRERGNRWLTGLFNLLYRQRLTDLYTGMKGMRSDVLNGLDFERSGFEHVVELAAKLAGHGITITEIPVEYSPRRTGRSKMRHLPELLKAVSLLVYYRVAGDG